jgi:hypothetical protein
MVVLLAEFVPVNLDLLLLMENANKEAQLYQLPIAPTVPSVPVIPSVPSVPSTPTIPSQAATSSTPIQPVTLTQPIQSNISQPTVPVQPVQPTIPSQPATPIQPTVPISAPIKCPDNAFYNGNECVCDVGFIFVKGKCQVPAIPSAIPSYIAFPANLVMTLQL